MTTVKRQAPADSTSGWLVGDEVIDDLILKLNDSSLGCDFLQDCSQLKH